MLKHRTVSAEFNHMLIIFEVDVVSSELNAIMLPDEPGLLSS